ncbi:hypothetical protein [Nocardia wallacei]|uniref:hypothetical protein n=1 Tax=Nocardia wallacei TaxID=480035 RepID=UPI002453ADD3|nr:hypothetical protein [Nocardia wallacei]
MTRRASRSTSWPVRPDGTLHHSTAHRIDEVAVEFIDVVHGEGDRHDIARLVAGMGWPHLIGLAISIASLVPPRNAKPVSPIAHSLAGMSQRQVLDARAAYVRGVVAGRRLEQGAAATQERRAG